MTCNFWRWSVIGLLVSSACTTEATARHDEALGAGASAADGTFAEAGQAALSPEELDRLLDTLEAELETQEHGRR